MRRACLGTPRGAEGRFLCLSGMVHKVDSESYATSSRMMKSRSRRRLLHLYEGSERRHGMGRRCRLRGVSSRSLLVSKSVSPLGGRTASVNDLAFFLLKLGVHVG
jgi:hypothetical protein